MEHRQDTSVLRIAGFSLLSLLCGAGVWFYVQDLTGKNNFGDQVNPLYFVVLYTVAFALGTLTRHPLQPAVITLSLVFSQVGCYLYYPNTAWELGNLFPVAAAFLAACATPASIFAYAGWLLSRLSRRSDRP